MWGWAQWAGRGLTAVQTQSSSAQLRHHVHVACRSVGCIDRYPSHRRLSLRHPYALRRTRALTPLRRGAFASTPMSSTAALESDEETAALCSHARSSAAPAVLIIHRLNKPSNIGGMVRSAIALGVSHVCLVGRVRPITRSSHVDVHSNKPSRVPYLHMTAAALNLCFHDKTISFSRFATFADCWSGLRSLSYSLVCVEISASSQPSTTASFPLRSALLVGNETMGIEAELLQLAELVVRIPQWGQGSSLNVVVAASICMYEYLRAHGREEAAVVGHKYTDEPRRQGGTVTRVKGSGEAMDLAEASALLLLQPVER